MVKALRFAIARRFASNEVTSHNFASAGYRKPASTSRSYKDEAEIRNATQAINYLAPAVAIATGTAGVASYASKIVHYIGPARDVLALANTEVDLSAIPEGKSVTLKWRGKPLFVRHRASHHISDTDSVDPSTLRDPQAAKDRLKDDKYMICLGICTHLGCVPIPDQGDFGASGGYYCPCHGSHYDSLARIRKGPAPLNLEVPPYTINGDTCIVG